MLLLLLPVGQNSNPIFQNAVSADSLNLCGSKHEVLDNSLTHMQTRVIESK